MKGIAVAKNHPILIRLLLNLIEAPSGCWEWQGRTRNGYGVVGDCGVDRPTHRVAYELFHGPVQDGLMILHSCDNPSCCNPEHLRAGTALDNVKDMIARGRAAWQMGGRVVASGHVVNNRAKLSPEQAMAIYEDGRRYVEIAAAFGVSLGTIGAIKKGRAWANVTGHVAFPEKIERRGRLGRRALAAQATAQVGAKSSNGAVEPTPF